MGMFGNRTQSNPIQLNRTIGLSSEIEQDRAKKKW